MPVDVCQSPPAALQSAWLVIFDSELPLEGPDGLADGEEPDEEPDDEPVDGDDIEPLLEPVPVAPVLPVPPVLLPEVPAPLLAPASVLAPPLAPPPVAPPAAAANPGAKVIIPIKSRVSIFFIRFLLAVRVRESALPPRSLSNFQTRQTSAHGVAAGDLTTARRSISRNAATATIVTSIAAPAKRTGVAGSAVTSRSHPASGCTIAITR